MKNSILSIILISIASVFFGCNNRTCEDYANNFRKEKYLFCIKKKYLENRFEVFEGINQKGELEIFHKTKIINLFKAAEIGDTIRKDYGTTKVILCKKMRTDTFPMTCRGKVVN
jgi:hypothetical protein